MQKIVKVCRVALCVLPKRRHSHLGGHISSEAFFKLLNHCTGMSPTTINIVNDQQLIVRRQCLKGIALTMHPNIFGTSNGLLVLGPPPVGGTDGRVICRHPEIGKALLYHQRYGTTATPQADNKRRSITTGINRLTQPVGV